MITNGAKLSIVVAILQERVQVDEESELSHDVEWDVEAWKESLNKLLGDMCKTVDGETSAKKKIGTKKGGGYGAMIEDAPKDPSKSVGGVGDGAIRDEGMEKEKNEASTKFNFNKWYLMPLRGLLLKKLCLVDGALFWL